MVITSGGVSVGERDVVKKALSKLGTVRFERVAMQPGMPQGFGTIGPDSTPIFCLPGNPVSALIAFEVFVRPAMARLAGATHEQRYVRARLLESLAAPAGKRQFRRAELSRAHDGYLVRPHGGTGSHLLAGLAGANSLIVVDEETTAVPAGSDVDVLVLTRADR
jgi:molybdopterin molybdotransferase